MGGRRVFGAMFAYIGASPFVLQDIYGLSQQEYSLVFAVNAAGLIGLSQAVLGSCPGSGSGACFAPEWRSLRSGGSS